MASEGVHSRAGAGLQVLGYRHLLVSLLFIMTTIGDVYSSGAPTTSPAAPVPAPVQQPKNFSFFNQYEADALNAVLRNWTKLNPQLTTLLNWLPDIHPCTCNDSSYYYNYSPSDGGTEYQGSYWTGIWCTPTPSESNATGTYYEVYVSTIQLYGAHSACGQPWGPGQCGFDGIKGVLPSELGGLINLGQLYIGYHLELTGPVPIEIWMMPNLTTVWLTENSLSGQVDSDFFFPSSLLHSITLSYNNFSGSLLVSSNGTLFSGCSFIDMSFNQLNGSLDFEKLISDGYFIDLSNNHLTGVLSTGPFCDMNELHLSNNDFTGIRFANFSGPASNTRIGLVGTVYMPSLNKLIMANNKLSGPLPDEFLHMPNLIVLDLSNNSLSGSVDFRKSMAFYTYPTSSILNISYNNFNGTFFGGSYINPNQIDLSNNYFSNIVFDIYNGTENGIFEANDTYMPQLIIENATDSYMPQLQILNIENNNLSGEFPIQILKAPRLQMLYGGQNQYNILQLPNMPIENLSLLTISLTDNSFDDIQYSETGPLTSFNLQFSNLLFLSGNPMCNKINNQLLSIICRANRSSPILNVVIKSNIKKKVIIATSSTATALAFILTLIVYYVSRLLYKIRALRVILKEFEKKDVKPNLYSYKELQTATNNFDKQNKLGEGGFGVVYKGQLCDGTIIAVKKLTMASNQMLSEFLNEVVLISGLKHRNLVHLKGCCFEDGEKRMLVFEYVENKDLADVLWKNDKHEHPYLDWPKRFKIIVGVAQGLTYLHEELHLPIIHRDIKAANILLDKQYNPKIADFGLAYLFSAPEDNISHMTLTQIAGTRGYCSPEYIYQGHISTAIDVYSFGILVLEIVSGRKNIDPGKPGDELYLRDWAWRQFEAQTLMTLIDSNMNHSSTEVETILCVITVALACVQNEAQKRPKMHEVVSMLFGNIPIIDFCIGFQHGEMLRDFNSNFTGACDMSLSFSKKEKIDHIDECRLLSENCEIEMSDLV